MSCLVDFPGRPALFWGGKRRLSGTGGEGSGWGYWKRGRKGGCRRDIMYERKIERKIF